MNGGQDGKTAAADEVRCFELKQLGVRVRSTPEIDITKPNLYTYEGEGSREILPPTDEIDSRSDVEDRKTTPGETGLR